MREVLKKTSWYRPTSRVTSPSSSLASNLFKNWGRLFSKELFVRDLFYQVECSRNVKRNFWSRLIWKWRDRWVDNKCKEKSRSTGPRYAHLNFEGGRIIYWFDLLSQQESLVRDKLHVWMHHFFVLKVTTPTSKNKRSAVWYILSPSRIEVSVPWPVT